MMRLKAQLSSDRIMQIPTHKGLSHKSRWTSFRLKKVFCKPRRALRKSLLPQSFPKSKRLTNTDMWLLQLKIQKCTLCFNSISSNSSNKSKPASSFRVKFNLWFKVSKLGQCLSRTLLFNNKLRLNNWARASLLSLNNSRSRTWLSQLLQLRNKPLNLPYNRHNNHSNSNKTKFNNRHQFNSLSSLQLSHNLKHSSNKRPHRHNHSRLSQSLQLWSCSSPNKRLNRQSQWPASPHRPNFRKTKW